MSRPGRRILRTALALLLLALPGLVTPPPAAAQAQALRSLDLRVSPVVDLFYHVRTLASAGGVPPADPSAVEAIGECARLEQALGGSAAWGLIEGAALDCTTPADLRKAFEGFPESYDRGGRKIPLRSATLKFARALEAAEPWFREAAWPIHRRTLEAARRDLLKELAPREPAWLDFLVSKLDLEPPARPMPLYLVAAAPAPRAFTRVARNGRAVGFVGVGSETGLRLAELPVHELIHGLDAEQGSRRGALRFLRQALAGAGVAAGTPESFEIVHLLMYVHSGETVRRAIDPAHVAFGEWYGTYSRAPKVAPLLYARWGEYLDGTRTRESALEAFVAQYLRGRGSGR